MNKINKKKGYLSYWGKTILWIIGIYFILFILQTIFAMIGLSEARDVISNFSYILTIVGIIISPGVAGLFYYTQK